MTNNTPTSPPKLAIRFLSWFLKEELLEEVIGDLEESYLTKVEKTTKKKAKLNYWFQSINYLRPFAIRNDLLTQLNPFFMFRHNLKITFRKFRRNKTSFLINLTGLSTGLACALFIFLWIQDERSVDKFNENDDQLYEVLIRAEMANNVQVWKSTPGPLAEAMLESFPEVEAAVSYHNRFMRPKGILVDDENSVEVKGLYAKPNYFEMFTYPFVEGTKQSALTGKNNIVLTESVAKKLFGSAAAAMNKSLEWKNEYFEESFQVAGVCKDPLPNATNQFDAVIQYQWLIDVDEWANDWTGGYASTVLRLKEGADINQLNDKLTKLFYSNREAGFKKRRNLFLRKYSDGYLFGNYEDGVQTGGRIVYVRLFFIIAIFILLIACINFMNLSTAEASKKTKEIGVKKAIGVQRSSLISQFLGESILMVLIAMGVALILVATLLPAFNALTGKSIQLQLAPDFLLPLLLIGLLTGLAAGSYPAFYLSGFNPIMIFKDKQNRVGGQWIRKGLVVFQFALSLIFIVCVLVIHQQMKYIQNKNLGYDRENVITFQRISNNGDPQIFLNELRKIPGVISAGNTASTITNRYDNQSGYSWRGEKADKQIRFEAPRIGYNFLETLGIELAAGRSFSIERRDTFDKIMINEAAAKFMNLENPIGTMVEHGTKDKQEIIGVVKDFQYGSIHKEIEPLILRFRKGGRNIVMRLKSGEAKTVIPLAEKLYQQFHPGHSFKYSFLDEDYQRLYESETKLAVLSKCFSLLAIVISCLGLFGLAMFMAESRKKEIGIRKVLGASVFGIVQLLGRDFTRTVLIAILLATPLSIMLSRYWLGNFAYHIDLQWWYFVIPSLAILLITWLTVGVHTVQAASVNPTETLKSE